MVSKTTELGSTPSAPAKLTRLCRDEVWIFFLEVIFMSLNNLLKYIIPFISIILIVPILFVPTLSVNSDLNEINLNLYKSFNISDSIYYWPVPRLHKNKFIFWKT